VGPAEQVHGRPQPLAGAEDVAQHDDLVDRFPPEPLQGGRQVLDLLVDVGQDAESHVGDLLLGLLLSVSGTRR
jgi:hypothetical protein